MKNIHFTLLIISILILNSCGSTSLTTHVNPHAEPHIKMHQDFIDAENQKIKEKEKAKEISEINQSPNLQQILLKKWNNGIDFYAFGNEPSWSLDMDFDKAIRFKNIDGIDFNAPMVEPSKAMDATNVTRYRSVTEFGEIIVQINQVACMDNMSGEAFNYRVTVDYKSSVDTDYQSFKGCGNFVIDPRLHDLWAIQEVAHIKINPEDFKSDAPRLELNIYKKSVFGHDGCNSFTGGIEVENGTIIFGDLASTLMACIDNTEISAKIRKTISGKKLAFKIENNYLIFFDKAEKVMILKHID